MALGEGAHQDVVGLEVAVNVPLRVEVRHGAGNLQDKANSLVPGQLDALVLKERSEVTSLNEFCDYVEARLVFAYAYPLSECGMWPQGRLGYSPTKRTMLAWERLLRVEISRMRYLCILVSSTSSKCLIATRSFL